MTTVATTATELRTRAEDAIGATRVAELLAMDLGIMTREMGKAYKSFNDAEYHAISDLIMFRSLTWAPAPQIVCPICGDELNPPTPHSCSNYPTIDEMAWR